MFIPFIKRTLASCRRLDLVGDVFREDSLKNDARDIRGSRSRRRVVHENMTPRNWSDFLTNGMNKTIIPVSVLLHFVTWCWGTHHCHFRRYIHVNWLWTGKTRRYIHIYELVEALDPEQCRGLLFFHSVTGCDTISAMFRIGKKRRGSSGGLMIRLSSLFPEWPLGPNRVTLRVLLICKFCLEMISQVQYSVVS